MKKFVLFISLTIVQFGLFAWDVSDMTSRDYIFLKSDTGYELYIKKYDNVGSILLTESQRDPEKKKTNYGLRTEKFYPCNGNETRILDGKILQTEYDAFFLVDSTPEIHPKLGAAFHFFLPEEVIYGYSWGREGKMKIYPGMRINARFFAKEFADYSGGFTDQWITLRLHNSKSSYHDDLLPSMAELCELTGGEMIVQDKDIKFKDFLLNVLPDRIPSGDIAEVIFVFDTTLSMNDEMPAFKTAMEKIKVQLADKVKTLRIGFVLYKDYSDIYLNKLYPLSDKEEDYQIAVKALRASGGDDIPEAVYEALIRLNDFEFISDNRVAFLIADAPPHRKTRSGITIHDAANAVSKNGIKLITLCIPFK
ncbi:MAG: VWA domain-containing protein [Spirochaetales bacterium]|nr:VWA domain-containing protein [Spirochaetales bacterium]